MQDPPVPEQGPYSQGDIMSALRRPRVKGTCYLRIVHHDSFGPSRGWEVLDISEHVATSQDGIDFGPRRQFRGTEQWVLDKWVGPKYAFESDTKQRSPLKSEEIEKHMVRLLGISIPPMVPYIPIAVADGCTYYVSMFGGIQGSVHFIWREGHIPMGWEPLQLVIEEMLEFFGD